MSAGGSPARPSLDPEAGQGFPGVDGPATSAAADLAINRIAAAIRRVANVAVGQPLDDDVVVTAADELTALAQRLEDAAPTEKRWRGQPDPDGHPQDMFPMSPVTGFSNPIAAPADVWTVLGDGGQREIRGRVRFGYQHEGPPTCVHGGVIAELFDEMLGLANIAVDQAGMTGTLTVRYRRPTPLLTPLDLASRFVRREGRKIYTWGGIFHQGELTAEAEGIFIEVQPGRMLDIVSGNAAGTEAQLIDRSWQKMIDRGVEEPGSIA